MKFAGEAVVPILAGTIIIGCGGVDDDAGKPVSPKVGKSTEQAGTGTAVASISGAVHVHGLGVNPTGNELLIATHAGLWGLPPGQPRQN